MRISRLSLAALAAALLLGAFAPAAAAGSHSAGPATGAERACPGPQRPGYAQCLALVATVAGTYAGTDASGGPSGYGPGGLRSAYNIANAVKVAGSGRTIAVVDAYNDPQAAANLNVYRSHWGLPACTTAGGCFRKVSQTGTTAYPGNGSGWSEEISLDLDMVSAICPECRILLVEAASPADADLAAAEDEAVRLGAAFVSNSYGSPEGPGETADNADYDHPGVAITASAGDYGYGGGTEFPSVAPGVTAVGGTSLYRAPGTRRGWTETAWPGTGSGCSPYEPAPAWQPASGGCSGRMAVDVSADANPSTGVAVYDTEGGRPGWMMFGGTSVAAPIIAGMYALAGPPAPGTVPASYAYAHFRHSNDVTAGSNGTCAPAVLCTAGTGYDGPTGMGTPDGTGAYRQVINTVTVANPGPRSSRRGQAIRPLTISASDSSAAQRLYWSASGLPAGLSVDHASGEISGRPRFRTSRTVTVTVTDHTGAWAAVKFTWKVR